MRFLQRSTNILALLMFPFLYAANIKLFAIPGDNTFSYNITWLLNHTSSKFMLIAFILTIIISFFTKHFFYTSMLMSSISLEFTIRISTSMLLLDDHTAFYLFLVQAKVPESYKFDYFFNKLSFYETHYIEVLQHNPNALHHFKDILQDYTALNIIPTMNMEQLNEYVHHITQFSYDKVRIDFSMPMSTYVVTGFFYYATITFATGHLMVVKILSAIFGVFKV